MRPGNSPHFVTPLQQFQHATIKNIETGTSEEQASPSAGVTKDGRATWIIRGPSIEVIDSDSRNCLATWRFGVTLKDTHSYITCVKEYEYGNSLKLLVGVCNTYNTGMVCLLDIGLSRVTKAIEIPHKVTAVEPVTNVGGDHIPSWALSDHLRHFYGIIAVGTEAGIVYLIDMCLDDDNDLSDEVMPLKLEFISPRSRDVAQRRVQASANDKMLCMVLDEEVHGENFVYRKCDGTAIKTLQSDDVYISCLTYIPQIGNLVVGFSFGCYQLWRLFVPVLEYSSRLEAEMIPVTHFSYQEPENDPKNFCYLWVTRGANKLEDDFTSYITLYQLAYNKKTWYSNYGAFYEELTSVSLRFDLDLTHNPPSGMMGGKTTGCSRVISCYTLSDPDYVPLKRLLEEESFEESVHGPDLSLCAFVWESADGQNTRSSFHLGIFDMNRWYHAQMPTSLRSLGGTLDTCSYFSFLSLDEAIDVASPESLLAVHVDVQKLRKFINNSPLPPEQHFYPASLAFDVTLVMECGLVKSHYLGTQRQVLASMQKIGPSILLNPKELYNLCIYMGLLPRPLDSTVNTTSPAQMRDSLLEMSLDKGLLPFIIRCVQEWSMGEYVHHGCTLKTLLDWAWERVAQVKQMIDVTCVPLYDWSGLMLDQRSMHTLHQCHQKLVHLNTILKALSSQAAPTTDEGSLELQNKIAVVTYLTEHLEMVRWFIGAGLLPENDEADELYGSRYSYPAGSLIQAFRNRRHELQKINSLIGETDLLMVDGLVQQMGSSVTELWDREGGSGLYPPPSLHAMLSVYLLDGIDVISKHALTLYLLLDLVSLAGPDWHEQFSEKISKFAGSFSLPFTLVKQIQGFWLLDHKDFEEAMVVMLDPLVMADLGKWQHCRVIKSLLYQGDHKMALRYLNSANPTLTNPDEVKLKLTVLLANGLTAEALEYQRTYRDQTNMQDLLQHLFLGCHQTKTVDQLLQLPLTDQEEKHLIEYLSTTTEAYGKELLVMYYLQRARYVEAIRLNEKLKQAALTEGSTKARERAVVRNAIIDGFVSVLSSVQRKLIFENQNVPKKNTARRREVRRPQPLSTTVTRKSTAPVKSQSNLFLEVMERVQDINYIMAEEEEVHTPNRLESDQEIEPFICTPVTPRYQSKLSQTLPVVYPRMDEDTENLNEGKLTKKLHNITMSAAFNTSKYSSPSNTNKYKLMGAKALSLLETPKVIRKTPPKQRTGSAMALMTPQSILKVKNLIAGTPSPQLSSSNTSLKGSAELRNMPLSAVPKHLGFNDSSSVPNTPRSVSFAETPSVTTPKQLRFSEARHKLLTDMPPRSPGGSQKKLPRSPPSPKSLRDRSPTPESVSLSPKNAPKMDRLQRPALHSDDQLNMSQDSTNSEGEIDVDDNITFNFHKTQREPDNDIEEMETADTSTETLPMKSPPSEGDTVATPVRSSLKQKTPSSILKSRSPKVKLDKSPRVMFADAERTERDEVSTTTGNNEPMEMSFEIDKPIEIGLTMEEEEDEEITGTNDIQREKSNFFKRFGDKSGSVSFRQKVDSSIIDRDLRVITEPDSSSGDGMFDHDSRDNVLFKEGGPSTSFYKPKHVPVESSSKTESPPKKPLAVDISGNEVVVDDHLKFTKSSPVGRSRVSETAQSDLLTNAQSSQSTSSTVDSVEKIGHQTATSVEILDNEVVIGGLRCSKSSPNKKEQTENDTCVSDQNNHEMEVISESEDLLSTDAETDFTKLKQDKLSDSGSMVTSSDTLKSFVSDQSSKEKDDIHIVTPRRSLRERPVSKSPNKSSSETEQIETKSVNKSHLKTETPKRGRKQINKVTDVENETILSPRRSSRVHSVSVDIKSELETSTSQSSRNVSKLELSPIKAVAGSSRESSPSKKTTKSKSPSRKKSLNQDNALEEELVVTVTQTETDAESLTPSRHSTRLHLKYTSIKTEDSDDSKLKSPSRRIKNSKIETPEIDNSLLKSPGRRTRHTKTESPVVSDIQSKSPGRKTRQLKAETIEESDSLLKSPGRKTRQSTADSPDVDQSRLKSPGRKSRQTQNETLDDESKLKSPGRKSRQAQNETLDADNENKLKSPGRKSRQTKIETPEVEESRLKSPGRKSRKQKSETSDVNESHVKSPGRKTKQKIHDESLTTSIVEEKTPSRRETRNSSRVTKSDDLSPSSTSSIQGVLLTPPESGKDSPPDKSEDEDNDKTKVKRRSTTPNRQNTNTETPTRRSSRRHDKTEPVDIGLTEKTPKQDSTTNEAVSPSYQFAEPMEVELLKSDITNMKPSTPLKSFIFSPPVTRTQSLQQDESFTHSPNNSKLATPILLPAEPSEPTTSEVPRTRLRKDDSKKRQQKDSSVSLPDSFIETSLINDPPKEKKPRKGTKKKVKDEPNDSVILISPVITEEDDPDSSQVMTRNRLKRLQSNPTSLRLSESDNTKSTRTKKKRVAKLW